MGHVCTVQSPQTPDEKKRQARERGERRASPAQRTKGCEEKREVSSPPKSRSFERVKDTARAESAGADTAMATTQSVLRSSRMEETQRGTASQSPRVCDMPLPRARSGPTARSDTPPTVQPSLPTRKTDGSADGERSGPTVMPRTAACGAGENMKPRRSNRRRWCSRTL